MCHRERQDYSNRYSLSVVVTFRSSDVPDVSLVDSVGGDASGGGHLVVPWCIGAELGPLSDVLRTYSKPFWGPEEVVFAMSDSVGCG